MGGVTQDQCMQVFSAYGNVANCRVWPPKQPGGRSFAMVRFTSEEEAAWVVENLNGNLAEGFATPITVRFANQPGQKFDQEGHAGNRSAPYQGGGKGKGKGGE